VTRLDYTQAHAAAIESVDWFVGALRFFQHGAFNCADFALGISESYADIALSYVEIKNQ